MYRKYIISIVTLSGCVLCAGFVNLQDDIPGEVKALLDKHMCSTCHVLEKQPGQQTIGPTYKELASKGHSVKETIALIYQPDPSNWPDYPPMAPMPHIDKNEVKEIAKWIVSLNGER